jgi:oligoribonuclease
MSIVRGSDAGRAIICFAQNLFSAQACLLQSSKGIRNRPLRRTMAEIPSDSWDKRLVWVDCEMTGLDVEKDVLLEVAVLITDAHLNVVAEGPEIVLHHPDDVLSGMGAWCREHHGASGLTAAVRASRVGLESCEDRLLDFVSRHTPKGKCPLAGNSIGQDAKFLSKYMPRLMNQLHYRVVDVSTVKELCRRWYPLEMSAAPTKNMSHRALDDIKESIDELRFYRQNVFK